MSLYICRWQNGNVSAVSAASRENAILLLNEIGNAEACELFSVTDFMVHFRLKDEADNIEGASPLELQEFGGKTLDMLFDRVYPVYAKASMDSVEAWTDDESVQSAKVEEVLRNLNDALSAERTRQWGAEKAEISDSPEATHLQKVRHDIPKTMAEQTVKAHRRPEFLEMSPGSNKVQ
jgi:hypothetical protein